VNEKNSKGTLLKMWVTVSLNGDTTGIGIGNMDSITKLIKSAIILDSYTGYSDTMQKSAVNVGT
jgi:hypothetical protein